MSSLSDIASSIKAFLTSRPPYCSGTLTVLPEQLTLFYRDGNLDLSSSTPEELNRLADACDPATFGVNKEDVYDESYRKAGKLDIKNFGTPFNVGSLGLIDVVRNALLEGNNEKRRIRVKMYKLNVYGKDSFFKAHKDTPRSEAMFGSLVVVFPTPHQGGEFVLRQDGHEWEVDLVKMISDTAQQPCVGYVSFFSDVEHEVRVVRTGHRVTLTYNLYFIPEDQPIPVISSPAPYEGCLAELLYTLLANPDLLPGGGYLGFGLQHPYPVEKEMEVKKLRKRLKGNDATLACVLSALGITWDVRVFYDNDGACPDYLHKRIVDLSGEEVNENDQFGDYMGRGAEEVSHMALDGEAMTGNDNDTARKLAMVTTEASMTCWESSYMAIYDQETALGRLRGEVCIVADLPPSGNRTVRKIA